MPEVIRNQFTLNLAAGQFALSTDSMILGDFVNIRKDDRICDLGCGCGTIGLILCAKSAHVHVTGIELQKQAVEQAEKNILNNNLASRFAVVHADLREHRTLFAPNRFDCIVSNPPYYPVGSGKQSVADTLAAARSEQTCTLDDLCRCASFLLRYGGSFSLVHKPERLTDLMVCLRQYKLEPKRIQFVRHHPGAQISLVLLESRSGAKPGLQYEPDLILFESDGTPTDAYQRIYHC